MENILSQDFAEIIRAYDFSQLKNRSILVTGATGLIGSQLILFLDYLNRTKNYGIKVHALVRTKSKARRVFADTFDGGQINFFYGDVLNLPPIDSPLDYLIHGASITSSKDFVEKPVETIDIAVNGTMNMLRLAQKLHVKSFLYLSSMEVFGITDGKDVVSEKDLGYIDILSPRSSYSEGKRMCECLCASYAFEYGIPVRTVRLTQTLGSGLNYDDTRVAAQFARAVIESHDIVLKTKGTTKRPILYTSDAITAILTVMLKGEVGQAYTAANPDTFTTIRETAEMIVNKIASNKIKLRYEIKETPVEYAPNLNLNLNLDIEKLKSLGWKPHINLQEAYERTIAGMRMTNEVYQKEAKSSTRLG